MGEMRIGDGGILLINSIGEWREDLPDSSFQGTSGLRGHFSGPTRHQEGVLGSSTSPFASLTHCVVQPANNFAANAGT